MRHRLCEGRKLHRHRRCQRHGVSGVWTAGPSARARHPDRKDERASRGHRDTRQEGWRADDLREVGEVTGHLRLKGGTMSVREFLTNVAILSSIMAAASLVEAAVPMFSRRSWTRGRRTANLG